jgi:hypothetical protein
MIKPTNEQINKGIFKVLKYSYSLTIVIIVVVLFTLGNFLYNNVYQTLSYAKAVTDLKKQVSSEYPEVDRFNTIIKNIEIKTTPNTKGLANLQNPFE